MDVHPATLDGKQPKLHLRNYGSIYRTLETFGLHIVGADFYSHAFEIRGIVLPNWRPHHRKAQAVWTCTETAQTWRNIAYAAFQKRNGKLWDVSSRIAYHLRACNWRLREISESYNNQLNARINAENFEPGQLFEDGYTPLVYLALQTFLIDACILRDYLAEFAASVFSRRFGLNTQKVTTMAGLKKHVLDKITDSDALLENLRRNTDEGGWIQMLGSYRDLVVHSAPLAQAESKLYAVCEAVEISGGKSLPVITCPLPDRPNEIRASRAREEHLEDFETQFYSFVQASKGEIPKRDGMQYAHQVLGFLSELASEFAKISPVRPQAIVLNDTDIVGSPVVKGT